jgi:hypothetical protein
MLDTVKRSRQYKSGTAPPIEGPRISRTEKISKTTYKLYKEAGQANHLGSDQDSAVKKDARSCPWFPKKKNTENQN